MENQLGNVVAQGVDARDESYLAATDPPFGIVSSEGNRGLYAVEETAKCGSSEEDKSAEEKSDTDDDGSDIGPFSDDVDDSSFQVDSTENGYSDDEVEFFDEDDFYAKYSYLWLSEVAWVCYDRRANKRMHKLKRKNWYNQH